MLIETTAHALMPLGEMAIDDAMRYCSSNLDVNVQTLLLEGKESGLQNYNLFDSRFGQQIKFNNKNITFQTLNTGKIHLDDEEIGVCYSEQNPPARNKLTGKDINEFFGRGEFPFRHFTVVRIGNLDYFFYTITR
jgi:hypothetical protein